MRQRHVPPAVPRSHSARGGRIQGHAYVALSRGLELFKLVLKFFRSVLTQYVCILYIIIHIHPTHGMFRELRNADIRYFGYHSVPIISYISAQTNQEPMYIHTSMVSNTCVSMPGHAHVGDRVANAPASFHSLNSVSYTHLTLPTTPYV